MNTPRPQNRPVALALLLAASGCATQPALERELVLSEMAIESAVRAGAAMHASGELRLAQDKASLARRSTSAGDSRSARWLIEQARVDAELAELKAMSAGPLVVSR